MVSLLDLFDRSSFRIELINWNWVARTIELYYLSSPRGNKARQSSYRCVWSWPFILDSVGPFDHYSWCWVEMPVTCSIDPRTTVAAVAIAATLFFRFPFSRFGSCAIYYAPLLPFLFFFFHSSLIHPLPLVNSYLFLFFRVVWLCSTHTLKWSLSSWCHSLE